MKFKELDINQGFWFCGSKFRKVSSTSAWMRRCGIPGQYIESKDGQRVNFLFCPDDECNCNFKLVKN